MKISEVSKRKPSWRRKDGLLERLPEVRSLRIWELIFRVGSNDHTFRFTREPTLDDFLAVCMLMPYTSAWDEDVIPAIIKCEWPELAASHKRAEVVIPKVGPDKLTVRVTIQFGEVWSGVTN